jgi:predicted transcriptional regulator
MKDAVEMGSGARICRRTGSAIRKLPGVGGRGLHRNRNRSSLIVFFFFQNKASRILK